MHYPVGEARFGGLYRALCREGPRKSSNLHIALSASPVLTQRLLRQPQLGYETTDHLPINRGFKSHVGYLGGGESYFWGCSGSKQCNADPTSAAHDMWHDDHAGADIVPEIYYSANFYTKQAVSIISDHPTTSPFFLYLPYQNVHAPNQLPPSWEVRNFSGPFFGDSTAGYALFSSSVLWHCSALHGKGKSIVACQMWPFYSRHTYANMLHMLDSGLANVTAALSTKGMWSNTLLLFSADNGGIGGVGNNHPLYADSSHRLTSCLQPSGGVLMTVVLLRSQTRVIATTYIIMHLIILNLSIV